jgi:hypothetical protein
MKRQPKIKAKNRIGLADPSADAGLLDSMQNHWYGQVDLLDRRWNPEALALPQTGRKRRSRGTRNRKVAPFESNLLSWRYALRQVGIQEKIVNTGRQ